MKLKDFPLLRQGMYEIMMDQHTTGAYIMDDAEVSDHDQPQFAIAEIGLQKLAGFTLKGIMPEAFPEMPGYEDLMGDTGTALEHFYLPVNDLDVWIADWAGMKPSEYHFAQYIFVAFFDGHMRDQFMGALPGSRYAAILRQRKLQSALQ